MYRDVDGDVRGHEPGDLWLFITTGDRGYSVEPIVQCRDSLRQPLCPFLSLSAGEVGNLVCVRFFRYKIG